MAGEILDLFNSDAFSMITLTQGVQRNPYQPQGLGAMGIFDPNPIRTTAVSVEERQGTLKLIPFSQRGAEGTQRTTEKRKMRYFDVPRLMHDDTVHAYELQNIREFQEGPNQQVTVMMQLEREVARRLAGPTGLQASVEYTKEYLRLAAVQGLVLDPKDGSQMYSWFDEFGIAQAAEVAFNLAAGTANSLRPIINQQIARVMARKAQGAFTTATKIIALCGDTFYDSFVNHPDVVRTFLNWQDAKELRGGQGAAFDSFDFAGVTWVNYRGSDDNSTIKIGDDKVKFFPSGAPGIFQEVMAPGESAQFINQPGQPIYVLPIPDRDRNMWWKMEAYAYPLYMCTRPEVLLSGRAGS